MRCQRGRVTPCYVLLRPMLHPNPLINIHVTYVTSIFLFIEKGKKVITQHTLKTHTTSADYRMSPTCKNDVTYVTFNDYSVLRRNIGRNNQVTCGNSGSCPTGQAAGSSHRQTLLVTAPSQGGVGEFCMCICMLMILFMVLLTVCYRTKLIGY